MADLDVSHVVGVGHTYTGSQKKFIHGRISQCSTAFKGSGRHLPRYLPRARHSRMLWFRLARLESRTGTCGRLPGRGPPHQERNYDCHGIVCKMKTHGNLLLPLHFGKVKHGGSREPPCFHKKCVTKHRYAYRYAF